MSALAAPARNTGLSPAWANVNSARAESAAKSVRLAAAARERECIDETPSGATGRAIQTHPSTPGGAGGSSLPGDGLGSGGGP